MYKMQNKLLLRYLKSSGKIWTSPPGGTKITHANVKYKAGILISGIPTVIKKFKLFYDIKIIVPIRNKSFFLNEIYFIVLPNSKLQHSLSAIPFRCLSTTSTVRTLIPESANEDIVSEIQLPEEADVVIIGNIICAFCSLC